MIDREAMGDLLKEHFLPRDSGFCHCGFRVSNTEPGDRDHPRGWSTNADHMRKMFGRHLADVYNRVQSGSSPTTQRN